jgi:hypothetical protein
MFWKIETIWFFDCQFAAHCWGRLNIQWDMSLSLTKIFVAAYLVFNGPCFMEFFACSTWNIWKIRNDFIFRGIPVSAAHWEVGFQNDVVLHRFKVKAELVQNLID